MEPVWVPGPGEFVVAVEYLSIDPATRSSIAPAASLAQVAIGAVIEAGAIERVTTSEHPGFAVGKHVCGCTRGG
jgi:NADPH-dependent curcumin reductase